MFSFHPHTTCGDFYSLVDAVRPSRYDPVLPPTGFWLSPFVLLPMEDVMHTTKEYCDAIDRVLSAAQKVAQHVEQHTGDAAPREVMQFCIRHGYIGFPDSVAEVRCGGWLSPLRRSQGPLTMEDAKRSLAVIACFSDGVVPGVEHPVRQEGSLTIAYGGFLSQENRHLVITDADLFSNLELGVVFLHEARHARQLFGELFEGLPSLDPSELHETRTWEFHLRILDACGGGPWRAAVEAEAGLLEPKLREASRRPGDRSFATSGQYHASLNALFGSPKHERVRGTRNLLCAMRALFLLAARAGVPDDVAHENVVGRYYEWVREHRR